MKAVRVKALPSPPDVINLELSLAEANVLYNIAYFDSSIPSYLSELCHAGILGMGQLLRDLRNVLNKAGV